MRYLIADWHFAVLLEDELSVLWQRLRAASQASGLRIDPLGCGASALHRFCLIALSLGIALHFMRVSHCVEPAS